MEQQKRRSPLRNRCGRVWYAGQRYLLWALRAPSFATHRQTERLPAVQTTHRTILLRQLRDVDMQYQYNKIINLRLAVAQLDGLLLPPGKVFSYWRLIGRPSRVRGYVEGMVLNGGLVQPGVGGGLCQLSNLIYWMSLHTPLTVLERHRHGYDVFPDAGRTQPFGSGATCFYPHGDLMLRNDTALTFQLCLRVGETDLEGKWRATEPPDFRYEIVERAHTMRGEYWGGFSRHNELWRLIYDREDKLLAEEKVTENHALMMYSPFLAPPNNPEQYTL